MAFCELAKKNPPKFRCNLTTRRRELVYELAEQNQGKENSGRHLHKELNSVVAAKSDKGGGLSGGEYS